MATWRSVLKRLYRSALVLAIVLAALGLGSMLVVQAHDRVVRLLKQRCYESAAATLPPRPVFPLRLAPQPSHRTIAECLLGEDPFICAARSLPPDYELTKEERAALSGWHESERRATEPCRSIWLRPWGYEGPVTFGQEEIMFLVLTVAPLVALLLAARWIRWLFSP